MDWVKNKKKQKPNAWAKVKPRRAARSPPPGIPPQKKRPGRLGRDRSSARSTQTNRPLHENRFLKRRGRFFVSFPSFIPLHSLDLDAPAPLASHRQPPDRFFGLIPPLQGFLSCRFSPFFCVPRFLLFCRPTCLRDWVVFPARCACSFQSGLAKYPGAPPPKFPFPTRSEANRCGGEGKADRFFPHFVEAMRRFRAPWAPPRNLADLLRLARRALGFAI